MKNIILILFLAIFIYPSVAIAKDMRNISTRWSCTFPVETSGYESMGNFYPCKKEGCEKKSYIFSEKPDNYLKISNFLIEFKNNTVSYGWSLHSTMRKSTELLNQGKQSKNSDIYKVLGKLKFIDLTSISQRYSDKKDDILTVFFKAKATNTSDYPYFHTLSFHANGTKLMWHRASPFLYQGKTMLSQLAYGECEPSDSI